LGAPGGPDDALGAALADAEWLEPVADGWVVPAAADPAERVVVRESVRLAFVAALQVLPPRQRAALILRDVLAWRPGEIADLLGMTTVSVNSALQRARQSLASVDATRYDSVDAVSQDLLDRYVDAFERDDVDALVALLHEDASWTMPPYPLWFRGVEDIRDWYLRKGTGCRNLRLVPLPLNGGPGFALYRRSEESGRFEAFAVQSVDVADGAIAGVHTFLDPRFVELFGLPVSLVG
jgi:RNA polymerase sigma-70 factor, ECF subfamily